jgi:phospholipase/lecithinase/hemolysin
MNTRRLLGRGNLCVTAFAALCATTSAAAQHIDNIIAFGDSYADDGNAFQLGYANPQALQIYSTGRFSGGTNYIDSLSNILNAPVSNFAIGGAFGGSNNGTLCFDPFYAPGTSPLCGKGLQYEVDQFFDVGTQDAAFPAGATAFGEHDLLAVSIGGNDARFYEQAGGTLPLAAGAGTAAAAAASVQLDRLVAAGAPTISFLAGDTGRLPEVAPFPNLAQIRSTYSAAFNGAMQTTLAGYAADGVMVHYLDLNLIGDRIIADPAAYGLTSSSLCTPTPQCVTDSNHTNGFLFYLDGLHLTSAGFAIVAKYVATQLQAPLTLEATSELGLGTARQFGRRSRAGRPFVRCRRHLLARREGRRHERSLRRRRHRRDRGPVLRLPQRHRGHRRQLLAPEGQIHRRGRAHREQDLAGGRLRRLRHRRRLRPGLSRLRQ